MIAPVPSHIFNAEFLHSPAATAAAWISILGATALTIKLIGTLFKYRKYHNKILRKSGVPAFVLNIFLIPISLKSLPKIGWPEKTITVIFSIIFLCAAYYFIPALIQTVKAPPNATWLYWKKSGEPFYISKKMATAATLLSSPGWTISVDDCSMPSLTNTRKYSALTIEHKEDLCKLLTSTDGQSYLDKAIKKFHKDKMFIYTMVPLTMIVLLWLTLGFIFTIHYSGKVRKYILNEQKKAIHCAYGEFKPEGIYTIYQELDRNTLC